MRRVPQLGQTKSGADKIAGSDFEPPQAGPKGEGQDARSKPRSSPTAPTVGTAESDQAFPGQLLPENRVVLRHQLALSVKPESRRKRLW